MSARKFTSWGSKVDRKVGEQLDIIVDEILKELPGTRSIILTGGFSRGEGPVKVEKNRIYPYNDYDISAVTDRPVDKKSTDRIAVKAAKRLGLRGIEYFYSFRKEDQKLKENFYIDMKCFTSDQLGRLAPRIRYYEMRNTGMVIYGDDMRHLIPDYGIEDIPLSEPAKLLLDRMSQLVEYLSTEGKYDEEFLAYIIQQAYTACSTALLLLSGNFEVGYNKAASILMRTYKKDFPQLYERLPDLHKTVKKYVEWKTRPRGLPDKDVVKAWFKARDDIFEVSKYFFSRFLERRIETVEDMSNAILSMAWPFHKPYLRSKVGGLGRILHPLAVLLLKAKYLSRVKKQGGISLRIFLSTKSPDVQILSAVPYVMFSIKEGFMVEKGMFSRAESLLRQVYPSNKTDDWEGLSLEYAKAYITFFLQKLD